MILFTSLSVFTLLVLVVGIVIMAKGGKINKEYSNRLMVARVALQLVAVMTIAVVYFLS